MVKTTFRNLGNKLKILGQDYNHPSTNIIQFNMFNRIAVSKIKKAKSTNLSNHTYTPPNQDVVD